MTISYIYFYILSYQLKIEHDLPEELPEAPYTDEFLKSLHHAMMEVRS